MSVIVITRPDAENKEDANLILRNNLVLNIVLGTGCGVLTRVELTVTMGAMDLLATLRLPLLKNRHDHHNATTRTACTLYKCASIAKHSIFVCSILHTLYTARIQQSR
jgi:hypothetical protein